MVEDPVHVVDRLSNELRCDPEWPLRLVKFGDSRLGRFKLGRNLLDFNVDPLGSSRASAAKSSAQVGVFLLELANPRLRLIEIRRTPLGAHLDVLTARKCLSGAQTSSRTTFQDESGAHPMVHAVFMRLRPIV